MYNWRRMTAEQRELVLRLRKLSHHPWQGPPHRTAERAQYHVDAANYEHRVVVGHTPSRMAWFEAAVLSVLQEAGAHVLAWCILPNHYHLLIQTEDVLATIKALGRLHGRSSRAWNMEDATVGRTCWHRAAERSIKSDRHYWATMNYIHHNPVHHCYVRQWQEWPFSSARLFIEHMGHDAAVQLWNEFPVLRYGEGWDNPDA
jgi:putative transposase